MSDETGEFFPFRDENGDGDANQPIGRTRKQDDATSIWAEEESIWSGRAGVPAPGPGGDSTRTDWVPVPAEEAEEPAGKWWTPILVGIVAMVLLALLGWGIYLIIQSTGDGDQQGPAPAVSPTAAPSPAKTPAKAETKTETTSPSATPPSSPSDITIPALRGLSLDEARTALNRKGLSYRLRYVASTDAPPNTVIGSDPAEGQQVPGDTIINLIIVTTPTVSTTPPSAPTSLSPSVELDED